MTESLLLGIYIYKKDINKESSSILSALFVGGILSCFLVLLIEAILELIVPLFAIDSVYMDLLELIPYVFIYVALVEEFCKFLIVHIVANRSHKFDEMYDAIVYAVFASLGFAFFENLLYVYEGGISTGIMRAILAVPGHACFGVFMGYFLGKAKKASINGDSSKIKYLVLSIIVPMLLHGVYDYCLFANVDIFLGIFVIFVIAMFIVTVKIVKKVSSEGVRLVKNKYCPNCGNSVHGNFCAFCGRKND